MQIEALRSLLVNNGIDYSSRSKSVEDLAKELSEGESTINDKGFKNITIVECEITDSGLMFRVQHFKGLNTRVYS